MNVELKTPGEIAVMREGGAIAAKILNRLREEVKPGVETKELDSLAEKLIREAGAEPSFKGFGNYPNSICVSINDEVVHGLPKNRQIQKNDLVSLDIGVKYLNFHTDTALTTYVGSPPEEVSRLLEVTEKSLQKAVKIARPGEFLGSVQFIIQDTVEKAGFSVVRDLAGHGIGRKLQEPPSIPNFGAPGTGIKLQEGMTFALEPMVTVGSWQINILDDGWTVVTADHSLAAHFEHTIAITKNGAQVLTTSD